MVVGMLVGLLGVALGLLPSGVAFAHNSLVSTDPADGAVLAAAPTEVSFVFDKAVPLDSATITYIDPTGVRTELPISHAASGDNEVLASLAGFDLAGPVAMRWRLVGADGHVVSGRLNFTVPAAGGEAVTSSTLAGVPTTVAGGIDPASGTGEGSVEGMVGDGAVGDGSVDDGEPSNGVLGWLVRFGSYLAIAAVLAVTLLDVWVWPGVAAASVGRRVVRVGLAGVAVLGVVQVLIVASDLSGRSVLASFGELRPAFDTPVGQALTVRVVLAGVAALLLLGAAGAAGAAGASGAAGAAGAVGAGAAGLGAARGSGARVAQGRWTALAMLGVAMMGTWAWTGHSRTERWPWVGVPVDIVHHSAAALWLGGLAVLAWFGLRGSGRHRAGGGSGSDGAAGGGAAGLDGGPGVVGVVQRFSATAMVAVIVVAVTGVVQTLRLHDDLGALLSGQHGRLLAVKVAAFAGMLVVAAGNRRRVWLLVADGGRSAPDAGGGATGGSVAADGGVADGGVADGGVAGAGAGADGDAAILAVLRRAMLIDVVVGVAVLGVTASLVTSLR